MPETPALVEHLFRRQAGQLVSNLTRLLGPARLDLAEDCVQRAMLRALETWPYQGLPENPGGWLARAARNAAIDHLRRERKLADAAALDALAAPAPDQGDDELRMIFMCCHPQLAPPARVALSLKIVGGFSVAEIAAGFLSEETAIAQRLVRAKRTIREGGLSLELPGPADLPRRLDSVLDTLYLMFNEGYQAHAGDQLIRHDLCAEALRLALVLAQSPLNTPAVEALAALLALQSARLPARTDAAGDLVLFEDQDRALWDQQLIALGFQHFNRCAAGSLLSRFHVQAAIAATYARSLFEGEVWWVQILELYDQLLAMDPSPIVALNRAVVIGKIHGPSPALRALDQIALRDYLPLLVTRGQLLLQAGDRTNARRSFEEALSLRCSEPERRFLHRLLSTA